MTIKCNVLLFASLVAATIMIGASAGFAQTAPSTSQLRAAPLEPAAPPPPAYKETFGDCMGYWEPATHMSKNEWRQACRRTMNGTEQ